MLLSFIRMIQACWKSQHDVNELYDFSDRELKDIGLNRRDIPRVASGNYDLERSGPIGQPTAPLPRLAKRLL
jgi:uncharacterized protein YjiS (DUF1127 family)